jgi:hypothetical protein
MNKIHWLHQQDIQYNAPDSRTQCAKNGLCCQTVRFPLWLYTQHLTNISFPQKGSNKQRMKYGLTWQKYGAKFSAQKWKTIGMISQSTTVYIDMVNSLSTENTLFFYILRSNTCMVIKVACYTALPRLQKI